MKAAACSCRVSTNWTLERRSASRKSRFSSPGTPKIRLTPSFSSAATSSSAPFMERLLSALRLQKRQVVASIFVTVPGHARRARLETARNRVGKLARRSAATHIRCSYVLLIDGGDDGRAETCRRVALPDMLEHQRRCQQQRRRIRNAFVG